MTVGEYASEPFKLKLKGYAGCQRATAESKAPARRRKGAERRRRPRPVASRSTRSPAAARSSQRCRASRMSTPSTRSSAAQNIRTYAIVTNKPIDLFGGEAEVTGPGTNSVPCIATGGVDAAPRRVRGAGERRAPVRGARSRTTGSAAGSRTARPTPSPNNAYGRRLSAGNTLTGEIGFPESPCKREPGTPKLKVWMMAMNEPRHDRRRRHRPTGEFLSEPFQLAAVGYGREGRAPKPRAADEEATNNGPNSCGGRSLRRSHSFETAAAPQGAAAVLVPGLSERIDRLEFITESRGTSEVFPATACLQRVYSLVTR